MERALLELVSPTNPLKKNGVLFRCWNIIRSICEQPKFITKYSEEIDHLLGPVIIKSGEPGVLEFEDDIIDILVSTVNNVGNLGPNTSLIIKLFPIYCSKFENKVAQIYLAYTAIFQRCPSALSSPEYLNQMIEIGIKGMSSTMPDDNHKDIGDVFHTEAAMILHLAIQYLYERLSEEQWIAILQTARSYVIPDDHAKKSYYKARVFGIFLNALQYKPVVAITFLVRFNLLEDFVNNITTKGAYFITDYDRRLCVCGLNSLIREKLKEEQLDELTKKCIEMCIYLLHVQRIEQNKETGYFKTKMNLRSDADLLDLSIYESIRERFQRDSGADEDDEDDYEDFGEPEDEQDKDEIEVYKALMTNKGKAQISLKNFHSPIMEIDEFFVFIETIKGLKVALALILDVDWS